MNRRRFLVGAGILVLAGGAAAAGAWLPERYRRSLRRRYLQTFGPSTKTLANALEQSFDHLRFAPGAAERFLQAYRAVEKYPLSLPLPDDLRRQFLLSTNFVQQRGDVSREMDFVALYSPYHSPCYNPYTFVQRAASLPS